MGATDRGGEAPHTELGPEQRSVAAGELIPAPPPEGYAASRQAALASAQVRLFASLDPTVILARISNEDPLRLFELGARRVRERYVFIDLERLHELCLAFVAHAAAVERGCQPDEAWLVARLDRAIDSILSEDREEQRSKAAPNDPDDRRYHTLAVTLGVEPSMGRSAVVNFNALPDRARRGFFRLLIDNASVQDTLAEGLWKEPAELRHEIWDGLRALGHLQEGEVLGADRNKGRRKRS